MAKSKCSLCHRVFSGLSGFDKHLAWWNKEHKPGPDGNYRKCLDPSTLDMTFKEGVWFGKPNDRLRKLRSCKEGVG